MKNFILLAAGTIDLLANIPYIIDSLKGRTKPNIASWSTWVLINGIALAAAMVHGQAFNAVVISGSYFIGSLIIVLIGLFKGTRKYTRFDVVCQALALFGLVLWLLSKNPNLALALALIVDIMAVLPTIKHAYLFPHEETWSTYAMAGAAASVTVILASSFSFAALAIPLDFFLVNSVLAGIILIRRNANAAHGPLSPVA